LHNCKPVPFNKLSFDEVKKTALLQDRLDAKNILEIQNNPLDRKYMQQWADKYGM